jgi:hypothetical protein
LSEDFLHYKHDPQDAGSLSSSLINSIVEDRLGNLWIGTQRGLNKLDRTTGRFSRFLHDPMDPHSLGHDDVIAPESPLCPARGLSRSLPLSVWADHSG